MVLGKTDSFNPVFFRSFGFSTFGSFATGLPIQELAMICHKHVYQRRLFHMQKDFAFYQQI